MAQINRKIRPELPYDAIEWIQLARSENVGPITFHQLIRKYNSPGEALKSLPFLAARGGLKRPLKIVSRETIERELDQIYDFGAQVLLFNDSAYPPRLRQIETAPPFLTVKGRLDLLQCPLFAIVGARNASAMGKKMAYGLSQGMGQEGWGIASGLARGIDTAAHQGSLQTGTVAILAGGIETIYPEENATLYHKIAEEGILVAESPFGTAPHATLFPRRNRIVSGVSQGLLVVEAAFKSGSLLTASYALEQGRDVFAIPGHPLDPRARGCNQLIKQGATLVERIEDITRELIPQVALEKPGELLVFEEESSSVSLEKIRPLIYENLSIVPIHIDELIRECQLQTADVLAVLLEMELAGRVARHPGGKISLKEDWKIE